MKFFLIFLLACTRQPLQISYESQEIRWTCVKEYRSPPSPYSTTQYSSWIADTLSFFPNPDNLMMIVNTQEVFVYRDQVWFWSQTDMSTVKFAACYINGKKIVGIEDNSEPKLSETNPLRVF